MDPNVPPGGQAPGWVPPPDPTTAPQQWAQQQGAWGPPPQQWAPQQPWAPQPKRKRFGWVAITLAFLIGGFISFVITLGGVIAIGLALGTPDSISGTHPAAAEGADVVQVGQCLHGDPSTVSVVDQSDVVECNEAHDTEVAGVIEIPGGKKQPSDDDLKMYLDDACLIAFEGYVDVNYDNSDYEYTAIVPSDDAWADGDRTAVCLVDLLGQPSGGKSVRGSGD